MTVSSPEVPTRLSGASVPTVINAASLETFQTVPSANRTWTLPDALGRSSPLKKRCKVMRSSPPAMDSSSESREPSGAATRRTPTSDGRMSPASSMVSIPSATQGR